MKKVIKFKEKEGKIILSKKSNFSKKEKNIINYLLKDLDLINIEYMFSEKIISKKKKSIKIKFLKFSILEDELKYSILFDRGGSFKELFNRQERMLFPVRAIPLNNNKELASCKMIVNDELDIPVVKISKKDIALHMFNIGRTGVGKTKILEDLVVAGRQFGRTEQTLHILEKMDYKDDQQKKEEKREINRSNKIEKENEKKDKVWRDSKEYKDHFSGKAYKDKK